MSKAKKDVSAKPQRTRPVAKTNPTTAAFDVADELWAVLEPLIPEHVNTHRFGGGRPRVPDRHCANGIFYVLRTGCQGKALDKTGLCSGSTAHLRFQEWVGAGVFLQFWEAGLGQYDEVKGIDWEGLSMDGAMTKAPWGGETNWTKPYGSRQGRRKT
jgi:putative transposase